MELLKQEITKLKTTKAKNEGSLSTHNQSIAKISQELKSKKYANVDEEHRVQMITLHTTRHCKQRFREILQGIR